MFQAGAIVVINGRSQERTDKARDEIYAKFGKDSGLLAVAGRWTVEWIHLIPACPCSTCHLNVTAVTGDVSILEDANALVAKTIEEFGRIDIVVNNAGECCEGAAT